VVKRIGNSFSSLTPDCEVMAGMAAHTSITSNDFLPPDSCSFLLDFRKWRGMIGNSDYISSLLLTYANLVISMVNGPCLSFSYGYYSA
jgi:hypothetical protein